MTGKAQSTQQVHRGVHTGSAVDNLQKTSVGSSDARDFSTEGTESTDQIQRKSYGGKGSGRGGYRPGAGAKKGVAHKKTEELMLAVLASGQTPMEFLLQEMRNTENQKDVRIDCANKVAPYIHPKLASTEISGKGGKPLAVANLSVPVDPVAAAQLYKDILG